MRRLGLVAVVTLCALGSAGPALADDAAEAEELVRARYYDAFPTERAEALEAEGIARLAEMLADPAESKHHGNIVLTLGLSGHPDAFPILVGFASATPAGEVDRDAFRARTRLPLAMGHLARSDRRALQWLLQNTQEREAPDWRFAGHGGEKLTALLEEASVTGLALSGAPEARPILDARSRSAGADAAAERRRRHAENALTLHDEIEARGPDAVLRGRSTR